MAGEIRFATATAKHAELLASTMRAADVAELEAIGLGPRETLRLALERSVVAFSAFRGNELGAMFGVEHVQLGGTFIGREEVSMLWSLTAAPFAKYPVAFCKAARSALSALLSEWPVLCNFADGRYAGALRLIEHLRGEFGAPIDVHGQPFVPFFFRRTAA